MASALDVDEASGRNSGTLRMYKHILTGIEVESRRYRSRAAHPFTKSV